MTPHYINVNLHSSAVVHFLAAEQANNEWQTVTVGPKSHMIDKWTFNNNLFYISFLLKSFTGPSDN